MSLSFLRALLITDPLVVIITSILGTLDLIASFFDGRVQSRDRRLVEIERALLGSDEHVFRARDGFGTLQVHDFAEVIREGILRSHVFDAIAKFDHVAWI